MSDLSIEYLRENTCTECQERFCARGYTLCEGCLHGFPRKLDEEDIKRVKEDVRKK